MPHPIVYRGAQIGIQPSLNTTVPADIQLLTPGFSRIAARARGGYKHTNMGNRLPSATVPPGYRDGEVTFDGPIDFVCFLYMLASYFGETTPTPDGTNGQAWDFFLGLNSGSDRVFYTYENGSADRAERAINMFANTLTMNLSKETQNYTGNLICGAKERGATITPTPTEIEPLIIPSQAFNLYHASSKAALDTAVDNDDKMLTPFPISEVITFPAVAVPLARQNSDELSYAAVLDQALIPTFALKTTDEADFDELADLLDTGERHFFALRALGRVIAGGTPSQYECRYDFCGTLIEPETNEEEGAAAANTLTFQNEYDSTWGQAHNIRLVNEIPALQP